MPDKPEILERFESRRAEDERERQAAERNRKDHQAKEVRKESYTALRPDIFADIEQAEYRRMITQGNGKAKTVWQENLTRDEGPSMPSPPLTLQSASTDRMVGDSSPETTGLQPDDAIQSLQDQLGQQQVYVHRLEFQIQEMTQQRDKAITDCNEAKKRKMRAGINEPGEAARLREQVEELMRTLEDLQGQIGSLQLELERAKDREHELKIEVQELRREVTRLRNEMDSTQLKTHSPQNEAKEKSQRKSSKSGKDVIEIRCHRKRVELVRPKCRKSFFV